MTECYICPISKHPLIKAAHLGHSKCLMNGINLGLDVNTKSDFGDTALMFAAYWGQVKCVEILLDHGADIDVQNRLGQTASIHAHQRSYRFTPPYPNIHTECAYLIDNYCGKLIKFAGKNT